MREAVKTFLTSENGGAVEWILTIIAGAIIVAVAYISMKGSPSDLGGAIKQKGGEAAKKIRGM
jgi:hypothetical protein